MLLLLLVTVVVAVVVAELLAAAGRFLRLMVSSSVGADAAWKVSGLRKKTGLVC
jgi:hypothetical protein